MAIFLQHLSPLSVARTSLVLLVPVLAACRGPATQTSAVLSPAQDAPSVDAVPTPPQPDPVAWPPTPQDASKDWIRFDTGEWLGGEIQALTYHTLEFESDELGDLSLDWDDVVEVRTNRQLSILCADRTELRGIVNVIGDRVIVSTDTGTIETDRANLTRMVTGSLRERDHWSGSLTFGGTARSGNTDSLDLSMRIAAKRRTASSRIDLSFVGAYSELDGDETANNERFEGKHDIFISPRLFLTTLALELYRDPFQNLDLRAVPSTGLGYIVVNENELEWDLNLGLGYRFLKFASVEAGEDDTDGTGTVIVGTSIDSDLTEKLALDFDYSAQIGIADVNDTNQNASVGLTFDVWGDLDFNFTFVWTRVGQPERDEDGVLPEKDDYRLSFGLGWEF